jgi:hypothetical protein
VGRNVVAVASTWWKAIGGRESERRRTTRYLEVGERARLTRVQYAGGVEP